MTNLNEAQKEGLKEILFDVSVALDNLAKSEGWVTTYLSDTRKVVEEDGLVYGRLFSLVHHYGFQAERYNKPEPLQFVRRLEEAIA